MKILPITKKSNNGSRPYFQTQATLSYFEIIAPGGPLYSPKEQAVDAWSERQKAADNTNVVMI